MNSAETRTKHVTSARVRSRKALRGWNAVCALIGAIVCCDPTALIAQAAKPAVTPNFGNLPLSFTANQGQADKSVAFLAKGQGYGLYLTANQAVLALSKPTSQADRTKMQEVAHLRMLRPFLSPAQRRRLAKLSIGLHGTDTLRMELQGANAQTQVNGSDELPGTTNYFLGNDPTRWYTRMPTFAKVHYTGVYPGIDLIYYGDQRRLEYDFVVAPNINPSQVKLHFSGAQKLKLDDDGNLLVISDNGQVAFEKPFAYQSEKGQRIPIEGRYALLANHTVGFKVGKYDRTKALVIDPTLSYSTYLGGSTYDAGTAIAVDASGSIYVVGFTADADFPVTAGSFQTTNTVDNEVAFVAKLNAAGSALVYSTYLGGAASSTQHEDSDAFGIAVDAAGNAYVCGETYSNDFPVTTGAFQTTNNAYANKAENTYVSKLNPTGTALVYSTYLGGSGLSINDDNFDGDSPLRMTIDAAGSAYVVGTAFSPDFPTSPNAYQATNKAAANLAPNAFVAKLSPTGNALAYSTYLGGSGVSAGNLTDNDEEGGGEAGYGITVDPNGEAYVSGYTYSADFPVTANGYQQANHGAANVAVNAYVSKLNATGTALLDSTYLGGTGIAPNSENQFDTAGGDESTGVALDPSGNVYLTGAASSKDFPTTAGAYQTTNKAAANLGINIFVSKLDPTLSTLMYSTYIGGSGIAKSNSSGRGGGDFGTGIAIDGAGDTYVTGATESPDFPVTSGAFQTGPRSTEVVDSGFFTELNPTGTALQYSTYLGGSGAGTYGGTDSSFFEGDFFYDIALDGNDNAYLTGYAYSYDFPVTKNAIQTVNNAGGGPGGNSFIAKFGATAGVTFLPTTTTLSSVITGANVTFTAVVKPVTGTGIPTGTVIFYVNTTKTTTATLDATGTATFTTSQLSDTLNDVIAAYSGDATYGASGSSLGQNSPPPTDTAIGLVFTTPPVAAIGQGGNGGTAVVTVVDAAGNTVTTPPVTVTVTITGPSGFTPQTLTPVTTVNGVATFSFADYALTIPGFYSYIATSSGLISTGALESVAPVITGTSPSSVTVGGAAFTLNLNGNFTGFVGSENYYVCFNSAAETNSLPFTGTATAISTTVPAAYITTAGTVKVFIGDVYCARQFGNSVSFVVSNVLIGTTATLTIAPSPVAYGKPVTLTATVSSTAGAVTPGQVIFCNAPPATCSSQFNLGSAQLNAAGVASLPLYPGAVGTHTYEAVFVGTTTNAAATSAPASVTVTGAFPTTTSLTATGSQGSYTLTSTVVGQAPVTLTPTGSVSFIDQTNSNSTLGTAPLGAGTAAQALVAASGSPLTAGTAPYAVTTGDFNGDGFTDFAVENYTDGTVSVFLGNGDGTFKPQVTYPVGGLPEGIAAADVNGDGKLDLIVTNTGDSTVSVLLSNGDGTFQAQVTYATDEGPAGIVVADFNNDGKLDIATSNYYAVDVSILLGNGDGTFQAQVPYPAGNQPRTLTSGDFNGDGFVDLAVANQGDNTLSILFGNGDGSFQQQILSPTGTSPQGLAVADFNGDGIPDLAVGNSGDNTVGIILGQAGGTFGNMTAYAAGNGALNPVVADFNADGNVDIAVEDFGNESNPGTAEAVLLGNGDGTFQPQTVFPTGTSPYAAAVGLFNGDSLPDLVISNFGSNNETLLLDQITSTVTAALSSVAVTGAPGNHNVVATYAGDTNFGTSTSTPVVLVVPTLPAVVLNSISPTGATAGSSNTTLTASGSNFTATSVVNYNAAPLATTFVSATQLTAVIPAALLAATGSATITVTDIASGTTSQQSTFTIVPGGLAVTFSGPSTTSPGEQPPLTFTVGQPYPVDIAGTMTLTFAPDPGNPANPQVQFATGGTTFNFTLAANSTATPAVTVQAGTVSGTITVTLQLTASGVNVTPADLTPITIVVPKAAPTITALTFSASGNTLTVLITGYSSDREIQSATFNFTPAAGASLSQKTLTVPASTLFQTWYTNTTSDQYGSEFTYSQLFTISGNASAVGGISATLTNSIGTSTAATAP